MALELGGVGLGGVLGGGGSAGEWLFDPGQSLRGLRGMRDRGAPSNTASQAFAALTRQQWLNYVNTFVPVENQLIQYATSPETVSNAMSQASENVQSAFQAQEGATARRLRGLGVSLSPEEQAAQTRSFGLSRALADVQAQNVAGDLTRQRQQSILGNPAPDVVTMSGRV